MEHALPRRTWSLCMTSENHGTVGPAGCKFSHAPEKHERVLVVEVSGAARVPVAEFKGYVDGEPAVTWFDRDNMPRVGTKLFAGAAPAINVPTDEREKAFGEALSAIAGVLWEFENNNIGMENEVYGAERCQEAVRAAFGKTLVAAQAGQVAVPDEKDAEIERLRAELDKMWKARFMIGQALHNVMVGNQSAWIEWQHGAGAEEAMAWIHNGLIGPGLIPDGREAQPWYDANQDDRYDAPPCPALVTPSPAKESK